MPFYARMLEQLQDQNEDDQKKTCYFLHQSAKHDCLSGTEDIIFNAGVSTGHDEIIQRCLGAMSKALRKDHICCLKRMGASPPPREIILRSPLESIQYACCSWFDHLAALLTDTSINDQKRAEYVADEGRVHSFLSQFLLRWIEALAALKLRSGVLALQGLKRLADVSKRTVQSSS